MPETKARRRELAVGFCTEVEDDEGRRVFDAGWLGGAADLDSDDVRLAECRDLSRRPNHSNVPSELLHALFNRLRGGHQVVQQWIRTKRGAACELEPEVGCEAFALRQAHQPSDRFARDT